MSSPISDIRPISFMNKFYMPSKNRYIMSEHKRKGYVKAQERLKAFHMYITHKHTHTQN